jgi:hypothetical protein
MVKKELTKSDQSELKLRAVTEIVNKLIEGQKRGDAIDLNKLKNTISRELGMQHQPRLIDIIAAVSLFILKC